MFTFSLALIADHPSNVTLAGDVHNLIWVTLGNLMGGAACLMTIPLLCEKKKRRLG